MKTIRKISKSKYVLVLLAISILNLSCSHESITYYPTIEKSGKELFKEIVLFSGKNIQNKIPQYASIIEQLNSLTKEQQIEFDKFKNEIITNIDKINPAFFNKFKKSILTKDIYTIESILSESGDLIMASLSISKDYNIAYKEANRVRAKAL